MMTIESKCLLTGFESAPPSFSIVANLGLFWIFMTSNLEHFETFLPTLRK